MSCTVLVGLQWGDEGKGKIIDVLTSEADVVVRFQGGSNAGHTVEIGDKKYVLHLIPSGIFRDGVLNIIGNGVVMDPVRVYEEIVGLQEQGLNCENRLQISSRAQLVFAYHCGVDGLNEKARGANKIGTTKRGIGPCYSDKINRVGIHAAELCNLPVLKSKFVRKMEAVNMQLAANEEPTYDIDKEWAKIEQAASVLAPLITDTTLSINKEIQAGKRVLFEGAQGTWLDVDFGTYPFVTSSNTISGGACSGSGVSPVHIKDVVGIAKAYTTRVGEGPHPTELFDADGEHLSQVGREFGATTGRRRRCGWFDAVATRYSCMINGVTRLVVTKLDVLDQLPVIKVCVAYELDGERLESLPVNMNDFSRLKPIYEEIPGWQCSTEHVSCWEDLPEQAKYYVRRLAELVNAPLDIISVGPKRHQTFKV